MKYTLTISIVSKKQFKFTIWEDSEENGRIYKESIMTMPRKEMIAPIKKRWEEEVKKLNN